MRAGRVDCHRCAHYHVTWDERFPHGCRRMGFKSRLYPNEEVRRTMAGQDCRLFEKSDKLPNPSPHTPAD
jgi:hypothetical protein